LATPQYYINKNAVNIFCIRICKTGGIINIIAL